MTPPVHTVSMTRRRTTPTGEHGGPGPRTPRQRRARWRLRAAARAGRRRWPLAGTALLDRLRATGRSRPPADPTFADELRAFIEDGIAEVEPRRPSPDEDRWLVTADRLDRALSCAVHRRAVDGAERSFTLPLACGALMGVALPPGGDRRTHRRPHGRSARGPLPRRPAGPAGGLDREPRPHRAGRARHGGRPARPGASRDRWPRLDPSWLPRTGDVLRAPAGRHARRADDPRRPGHRPAGHRCGDGRPGRARLGCPASRTPPGPGVRRPGRDATQLGAAVRGRHVLHPHR